MALTGGEVRLERSHDGRVAEVTLSHGRYTVITWEMRQLMAERFAEIDRDHDVRVVVIRSDGEHFSSGGDIAGFMEVDPVDFTDLGHNVTAPARSTKPVVVAVDGYCFGVGLELALSCDIRLATERSRFALPEMNLGMIPGSGGTQRLSRLIGLSRAKHHIMTARRITGQEAADWGVVAELHPDRDGAGRGDRGPGHDAAGLLARWRCARPRRCSTKGVDAPLYSGIELERKAYAMLRASHDFAEGVAAFSEKRTPYVHRALSELMKPHRSPTVRPDSVDEAVRRARRRATPRCSPAGSRWSRCSRCASAGPGRSSTSPRCRGWTTWRSTGGVLRVGAAVRQRTVERSEAARAVPADRARDALRRPPRAAQPRHRLRQPRPRRPGRRAARRRRLPRRRRSCSAGRAARGERPGRASSSPGR